MINEYECLQMKVLCVCVCYYLTSGGHVRKARVLEILREYRTLGGVGPWASNWAKLVLHVVVDACRVYMFAGVRSYIPQEYIYYCPPCAAGPLFHGL